MTVFLFASFFLASCFLVFFLSLILSLSFPSFLPSFLPSFFFLAFFLSFSFFLSFVPSFLPFLSFPFLSFLSFLSLSLSFSLKGFIYLFDRDKDREGTQAGGVGEGEAGFPPSRESDVGLNPRTLGSGPELKADV